MKEEVFFFVMQMVGGKGGLVGWSRGEREGLEIERLEMVIFRKDNWYVQYLEQNEGEDLRVQ